MQCARQRRDAAKGLYELEPTYVEFRQDYLDILVEMKNAGAPSRYVYETPEKAVTPVQQESAAVPLQVQLQNAAVVLPK
jgi:hypothetical protein